MPKTGTTECVHEWVIEAAYLHPDGICPGVCRKCGAEKMYPSSIRETPKFNMGADSINALRKRYARNLPESDDYDG